MKAAVYHGRHDIRIQSVPEPGDPGPGEIVLEVVRAAICGTDSSEWAHGPLLIAEIGGNHEGDFASATRLTELAISSGADAVKFQLYRGATLVNACSPCCTASCGSTAAFTIT